MTYILDTNILINLVRKSALASFVMREYGIFEESNATLTSIASYGELLSFAIKNNWGTAKKNTLKEIIQEIAPIPIDDEDLVESYAVLDAFSVGKHHELSLPSGLSARRMGKNDLWIAATAFVFEASLITTDNDFDHLHGVFLNIIKIPLDAV